MELSILLSKQIIIQFLMLAVGFFLIRKKVLAPDDATTLSKLVLYVIIPCSVFKSFQIPFTTDVVEGLILAFIVAGVINFLFLFGSSKLRKPLKLTTIEEMTLAYPNAGNLILPIVLAVLGQEWVIYCCAYMLIQNVLIFAHCESRIRGETKVYPLQILLKPCVISCVIAAVFFVLNLRLPELLESTVNGFAAMIAPTSMLVIGMAIGSADLKRIFLSPRRYLICALRLLGYPLVILLLLKLTNVCALFPSAKSVLLIPFLVSCSSPAATITQMAQCYGNDPTEASALNTMSVCFLIVTMPIMVTLFQWML